VQLNYNYEIFLCGILIINSSYFHTIVVPYEGNALFRLCFQLKHEKIQTLGNDFIDLLGSSHLIPNYEKLFVYENFLMKCALFA
jgi:hypothetical protein